MTAPDFDERARELAWGCSDDIDDPNGVCRNKDHENGTVCRRDPDSLKDRISTALAAVWNEAIELAATLAQAYERGADCDIACGDHLAKEFRLLAGKEKK